MIDWWVQSRGLGRTMIIVERQTFGRDCITDLPMAFRRSKSAFKSLNYPALHTSESLGCERPGRVEVVRTTPVVGWSAALTMADSELSAKR